MPKNEWMEEADTRISAIEEARSAGDWSDEQEWDRTRFIREDPIRAHRLGLIGDRELEAMHSLHVRDMAVLAAAFAGTVGFIVGAI